MDKDRVTNLTKVVRIIGIAMVILAVLMNSGVIGYLFSAKGYISSMDLKNFIWTIQLSFLSLGLIVFICAKKITAMLLKIKCLNLYSVYFFLFFWLILLIGGLLVLFFSDLYSTRRIILLSAILIMIFFISFFYLAIILFKRNSKNFVFNNILFLSVTVCILYSAELIASFFVPKWPIIGLHGVKPEIGIRAWGRTIDVNGGFNFNSWGQRDKERTILPKKGVRRIIFVGDSLLEESTTVPFPVRTEQKLRSNNIEVINLGVSVSSPEDYYYRIKNIAIPLNPESIFLFFYLGNDFCNNVQAFTDSFLGIVAVYPRDSLFEKLNLKSLNHIITNWRRPVLVAWGKSGALHQSEQKLGRLFAHSSDEEIKNILISKLKPKERDLLEKKLNQNDMSQFYRMLRTPDNNLFRSYYLFKALKNTGNNFKPDKLVPNHFPACAWIKRCKDICNKHSIKFILVFIPDAFNVDTRMQELWRLLADMKMVQLPLKEACERIKFFCEQEGITYIDLSLFLEGKARTYLNPDGHLSQKGAEIISDVLAAYLEHKTETEFLELLSRVY